MKEHISEFYSLLEQLNEIGVIVPEDMATIILLSSLNKSFKNLVVAIETRDTSSSLSVLKIVGRKLKKAQKKEKQKDRRFGANVSLSRRSSEKRQLR